MKPRRLRLRGVTRFDDLTLDLDDAPRGLIAVVGPNGAGKTTLLECMAPTPLFLEFPSRPGPLKDWTRGRDALIELDVDHGGSSYRSVVQVDADYSAGRGKTEAFLYCDGEPVNDGKIRTYREAVARHFPPRSIFLASAFAAQDGSGSFVGLSTAERKELFADLLGLGRLQDLADRAKEHRKHADGLLADHERDVEELARKEERWAALQDELALARKEVERIDRLVGERERAAEDAGEALRRLEERAGEASKLRDELRRLEASIVELRGRVEASRKAREALPELREARGRLDRYQDQERTATAELRRLEGEITRLGRDRSQAQEDAKRERRELSRLEGEVLPHVERGQARRDALLQEVEGLDLDQDRPRFVQERLRKAEEAHRKASRELEDLVRRRDEAKRKAELLERVPCKGNTFYLGNPLDDAEAVDCGTCDFLQEARTAAGEVEGLVGRVESQEGEVLAATTELASAREEAAEVEELRRKVETLQADLAKVRAWLDANEDAPAKAVELRARIAELDGRAEEADQAKARAHEERDQALERQRVARTKLDGLQGVEGRLREAEAAASSLEEREDLLVERETRAARMAQDLEGLDQVPEEELAAARRTAQEAGSALGHARTSQRDAGRELGRLTGLVEALGDLEAERKALERRAGDLETRRAGFRLVEQGLGRNGVQALEIDAAGPEVSRLTNELLDALVAGRFQVALRTVQEATGGRKAKEVFDLEVFDALRDREGSHAGLSGGEQVVVSEALKLALAVFNASQWGTPLLTLWRDECDGALDPFEVRPRFPAMLRAALELGGFERVFFVTHDPSVADQADGILYVADGGARFVAPGEVPRT